MIFKFYPGVVRPTMLRLVHSSAGLGFMLNALYLILFRFPPLSASYHVGVDKVFGAFVFLTSQTLVILAIYYFFSLIAELGKMFGSTLESLERLTHKYSCVAGGFALFLTIAFYALCW